MSLQNVDNFKLDLLLETLVLFTKLYHKPFSADVLMAGLPIDPKEKNQKLFSLKSSKGLFSRAAARAGLKSLLVQRTLNQISPIQLPIILVLSNQGACILDSFNEDKSKAKIYMPADEAVAIWIDTEELESQYLGFAFMVKKEYVYNENRSEKMHINKKHWFWSTLKLSAPIYRDVLMASFLINFFVLATPLFTMNVYDRVIPNNATETLWIFAVGVLVAYLIDGSLKFARTYLLEIAGKKSDIIMSSILFEKVLNLKLEHHPDSVGSFSNNLKDFDSIRGFLANATLTAIIDLPFSIIFLLVIYYIGGVMVFIPMSIMTLIFLYALIIKSPLRESIESTHVAAARKNGILVETLNGIETIKSLGNLSQSQWLWEESVGEIAQKSLKSRILSASIPTVTQFLIQLNSIFVIIVGVYLIQDFSLSMGALIAVMILSARTLAPMSQVAALMSNYEDTKASYATLDEIVQQPSERPKGKKFVERPEFSGKIEFSNVSFAYPNTDINVLKNVSFVINPGENVGFIGRIGSGKSTIVKLILGLYEPNEGSILLDGIDIKQIDPADLRRNMGYVAQDVLLFRGTVKDNIIFRSPQVNDAQMIEASKISGTDEFVRRHPKGYEMPIGERGVGLSGGQRQSISIARAFLLDAPIMLFDEPSNSMDQLSEQRLLKQLTTKLHSKTALFVTQKMSLLEVVDRVIVMDNGAIYLDGQKSAVMDALNANKKSSNA